MQAFHDAGGWLVLHGLTPEGLADFNRLVGFEHLLRPFRRERVTIAFPRSRLLAGVSLGDVALYSSERIFPWQEGNFVASDTFSFVVDVDDVAPFGTWDSDAWYNFVNGMVSADGWKYIQNHPAKNNTYLLTLPKPQELAAWTWDGNVIYNPTRRVELIFDGDEAGKLSFNVPPDGEPATFDIDPPRTAKQIAIRHAEFDDIPEKRQNGVQIIGCDNVAFYAKRPADFRERVRPLLNSGGLVEYPRGLRRGHRARQSALQGRRGSARQRREETQRAGVDPAEPRRTVRRRQDRDRRRPAGLLARSTSPPHATQYRTERGWFGDARFTLKDLPVGEQKLAGVTYDIYEFRTSPVPTCIMLAGPRVPGQLPKEVKGIAVNRKADALFFLHTARIDQRRNEQEKKQGQQYEIVRYVVHYADGQDELVPIVAEVDIDDYRVQQPQPLPGATAGLDQTVRGHRIPCGRVCQAVEQPAAGRRDPLAGRVARRQPPRHGRAVGRDRRGPSRALLWPVSEPCYVADRRSPERRDACGVGRPGRASGNKLRVINKRGTAVAVPHVGCETPRPGFPSPRNVDRPPCLWHT